MARLRDFDTELPRFPVVTDSGLIKLVACASNVTGALELDEDGTPAVVRSHAKKGWVLLQELYSQEGRMDLWQAWQSHYQARLKAKRDGQKIPAFPSEYLPDEVARRRAGPTPNSHTWQMPVLAPVAISDPESAQNQKRGPGRPRKGDQA